MPKLELKTYLKAEDFEDEVTALILGAGEYTNFESKKDGTVKRSLQIPIRLGNDKERTWSPNATSQRTMTKLFLSDNTDNWINKTVVLYKIKTNVRGEMKDAIYVKDTKA